MRKLTDVSGTARQAMRRKRAPRALVSASGMNRRRICGAKQATKQAESARATAQENTDTLRIRL